MIPGETVKIRVNPRDCMGVVDVINNTGMVTVGMSFPMACSLVLSSLLQSAREAKLIPEREGFEYLEVMQQFSDKDKRKKKLAITQMHKMVGSELRAPAVQQRPIGKVVLTMEQRRADTRIRELLFKQDHAPDSWSSADQQELDRCLVVVAGEDLPPKGQP